MISGVAQVQVFGSQKYAVRAQLDPRALASRKIGIDEVGNALALGNVNLPTGTLQGDKQAFTIQATGQLYNAAGLPPFDCGLSRAVRRSVLMKSAGSSIVWKTTRSANWFNNERAVVLAIQRQPGTNTVEVVDSIKKLLPVFRSQIPPSVKLDVLYDRSVSIRESVRDVKFTLIARTVSCGYGHFPLSAQHLRNPYSKPCAAFLDYRDLCRHVSHGVQRRQYLTYGPDPVGRVCGG